MRILDLQQNSTNFAQKREKVASYIFGPVHSRRFGISLGIDLSPRTKQCNFDCLYCELEGKRAKAEMSDVAEVSEILHELEEALMRLEDGMQKVTKAQESDTFKKQSAKKSCDSEKLCKQFSLDFITVTANGEPTLYPHLRELILGIKGMLARFEAHRGCRTLILSNGSRFGEAGVQKALCEFDCVKFSLDAISPKIFKRIDRAATNIDINALVAGVKSFAKIYKGELFAEVLFVEGVNDSPSEAREIARVLREISPMRVDLSTIDRPPAYAVNGIKGDTLEVLREEFWGLKVFIARRKTEAKNSQNLTKDELFSTFSRRPWSVEESNLLLSEESKAYLHELSNEGRIKIERVGAVEFWVAKRENGAKTRQGS